MRGDGCESGLRRQPGSPVVPWTSQPARIRAGNAGFSRIRLRLQTPNWPILRWKSPKVSGLVREYSRFAETIGGDWFDHDCRQTIALCRGRFCGPEWTKLGTCRRHCRATMALRLGKFFRPGCTELKVCAWTAARAWQMDRFVRGLDGIPMRSR